MWFASIWIFTLKLPWQKGAEFFLRELYDGDAASNTLSWRWVAGKCPPEYPDTTEITPLTLSNDSFLFRDLG